MDNGEVLQGIEEDWSFMGANLFEWAAGFIVFLMISLFGTSPTRAMPFMLAGWVVTTTTFAGLRRSFPDEQRGLRNAGMLTCGFPPPGIPIPARLQPVWSACPLRKVSENTKFAKLGFNEIFPSFRRDLTPADE